MPWLFRGFTDSEFRFELGKGSIQQLRWCWRYGVLLNPWDLFILVSWRQLLWHLLYSTADRTSCLAAKETYLVSEATETSLTKRDWQVALLVLKKMTQFISFIPCFGLVPSLPSLTSINCSAPSPRQNSTALVLSLSKQMEFNGVAFELYTLNITKNCFCRLRKLGLASMMLGIYSLASSLSKEWSLMLKRTI